MPCKNNPALTIFHIVSGTSCSTLLLAAWMVQTSAALAGISQPSFVERFSKYAYEEENIHFLKKSLLNHAGLDSFPVFSREDVANVEVPYHLKKRYEDLKSKHEERHRFKRSSLAALFSKVHNNPGK